MDNIADVTMTGSGVGDNFGFSVSTAGDVNRDGYSDVIVGAYWNDGGGNNAGSSYIYFGGSSMDNIADVTMTGEAADDRFGGSVSTAGDVNGDGYSDVIVGAAYNNAGGSTAGRSYIYFGGSLMDNTADVTMTGEAAGDNFGNSVSTAGDVNRDGYSDVIVGAYWNDAGGDNAGRSYIYYGGTSMDNSADITMTGEAADDNFGGSVSTAEDVNGDGYSDVIIGANYNDAGGDNTGRSYIYFGEASMDNITDVTMTGEAASDRFGFSVFTAGDVNGDGYSDVIVGAFQNDAGGSDAGRAYLYLSSSPSIKPNLFSVKDVTNDQGGQLKVQFARSGYDIKGINIITVYKVLRSYPPGSIGFSWEVVTTISPIKVPYYTYTDNTPNDSSSFFYRILAQTANPDEYWFSGILSGRSVDNLAPLPPEAFYAQLNGAEVKLGWEANTEPDLRDYNIYRSDTPVGDELTLIGTTTDTIFIDTSPLSGTSYYYIQAFDIHENGSEYSEAIVDVVLSANIKIYLEGPYLAGSMSTDLNTFGFIPPNQPFNTTPWNYTGTETVGSIPTGVVDWILVELRSDLTTMVSRRAGFLKSDGSIVDLDGVSLLNFPSVSNGDYYVIVYQRNHIPIMTANPIALSETSTLYDYTIAQTQAHGTDAMKDLGGGVFGMYTGDSDGSGTVNAADRSNTWNDRNNTGYYGSDLDLSGTVNAADRSIVWNNRNISTQVPAPTESTITNKIIKVLTGGKEDE